MERWWADPATTRGIIASVDDRDPQQAMATAVLAAHALQREALAPLASQTLVDASTVAQALAGADLSPVADAVARVSRSSMGDGADEYGRLVAEDWRQQSIQSARDVLTRWVGQGMAWPTAVQRLSGVVGVPARDLGRTIEQLKAPMPDLVAADHGDRALLSYASRIAARQPEIVGKNLRGAELFSFNRKHPRDEDGRFSEKTGLGTGGRLERLARRKRRKRRVQRRDRVQARNAALVASQQAQAVDVFGSYRERRAQERAREARPVDYSATRTFERKADRKVNRKVNRARAVATQESEMLPKVAATNAMRLDTQAYVVVDRSEADALILSNTQKFNIKGLRDLLGSGAITAYSYDVIQDELQQGMRDIENPVVIEFNTVAATDAGPDSFDLADDAEYEIQDSAESRMTGSPEKVMDSPFRTRRAGSPAFSGRPDAIVGVISVGLANEGAFQRQGADLPMDRYDRIRGYNRFGEMEKALTGAELAEFNRNHPRDEEGKFADKPSPGRDERVARRQRRKRRQRRVSGRLAAVQQQSETVNVFRGPARQNDRQDARRKESEVDWSATRSFVRTRESDLNRLSRVYQTRSDARTKYDFANATALVLEDYEFTDLLVVGPDGKPLDPDFVGGSDSDRAYLVDYSMTTGVEAIRRTAETSSKTRQNSPRRPVPAQDEYRGYATSEEAAQAALEYIAENQMDVGTTMSWDPVAVSEIDAISGKRMWFPKRIGYDIEYAKVLVFGSAQAIESLRSGSDPDRLKRIPVETFSELLSLRATDEALDGIDPVGVTSRFAALPNPLVRAYWYEDGDD
jgi:hypothetical protein